MGLEDPELLQPPKCDEDLFHRYISTSDSSYAYTHGKLDAQVEVYEIEI